MNKVIIILLLAIATNGWGNTHFSGIKKLKNTWHKPLKQGQHENSSEKIHIEERDGKFFLQHHHQEGSYEYEITKCTIRPSKSQSAVSYLLDVELRHPETKTKRGIIVKYTINQSLWFGLTHKSSTDLFTREQTATAFKELDGICE